MKKTHLFLTMMCLGILLWFPGLAFADYSDPTPPIIQETAAQATLARLEARRQARLMEAEKRHLILPSQKAKAVAMEPSQPEPTVSVPVEIPQPPRTDHLQDSCCSSAVKTPICPPPSTPSTQEETPAFQAEHTNPPMSDSIEPSAAMPSANEAPAPVSAVEKSPISEQGSSTLAQGSTSPLEELLNRFESKKQKRSEEAAKFNLTLPSQGGSLEAVSPSLAKLNTTLQQLIQKNKFKN